MVPYPTERTTSHIFIAHFRSSQIPAGAGPCPNIKTEHATTRRVIEAIPLDKGDYRPDPVSKSALELAWQARMATKEKAS